MTAPASALTMAVHRHLAGLLQGDPSPAALNAALRHLAKWRAQVLETALVERSGDRVLSGPFKGLRYPVRASEGSRNARLIGCYEASLHPVIEAAIARAYPQVLDIGCAEGFYANGFALRMPQTRVLAHDTDPAARAACAAMAAANGLTDRVRIGAEIGHADLALCQAAPTLILCDIEGAEGALLDPAAAPGLLQADLIVEVHEGMRPGLLALLTDRFAPTHRVTRIDRALDATHLPAWTEALGDLDRLLLLWEWRASPTPWLWLERKSA